MLKSKTLGVLFLLAVTAIAADETALFDSHGRAAAYIAEDSTIYLWSGKPVAYLYPDTGQDGFHVYGFNGRHLGWFVRGIIRNHGGAGACGVQGVVRTTQIEPIKSIKQIKPIKGIRAIPPIRPIFSLGWSQLSCTNFLSEGR